MRALFTCLPGYGSFYPMVPFAKALVRAGHTVIVATSASFIKTVESAGLDHLSAGYDILNSDPDTYPDEIANGNDLATATHEWLFTYLRVFRDILPQAMIPDLIEITEQWKPDLIVRENIEFGGCIAAEIFGLPHAVASAVEFHPIWVEEAFRPSLERLRVDHDLPPDPEGLMPHRYLTLAGLPPEWVGKHEHCPPTTHFVRPEPYSGADSRLLPDWIIDLPDRPTVHASLGTVFNLMPGVYEAIIEALRDEPVNLILTIGRQRDPAEFGVLPGHIRVEQYLPHSQLLPHCDVMISHAGYGSTMAFLMQGIPAVLLPLGGDQPRNAARVAELGAGIALAESGRTPENIRQAVRDLLDDESYRRNAGSLKQRLEALPGPDFSVRLLEQLAEHRQPILRNDLDGESNIASESRLVQ